MDMSEGRQAVDEFTSIVKQAIGFVPASESHRKYVADAVQWVERGGAIDRLFPILDEWKEAAGTANGQYFLQDLQVAQWLFAASPQRHVDVGSRIDGFVAHVAAFREIEVMDIRPLNDGIRNVRFIQSDLMCLDAQYTGYADSVSCLHALEHFGLGRYGDPIDPEGHRKGFASLVRMVKDGGTLYLSVPIGVRRVEFNAHRIFDPMEVFGWPEAGRLTLAQFSYVGDDERLHDDATPEQLSGGALRSGLGIYVFRKQTAAAAPPSAEPLRNRRPALRLGTTAKAVVTYPALGRNGRLGNQLFQVAATLGVARRNGCDALFPAWRYAPVFAGPLAQSAGVLPAGQKYVEPSFAYRDIDLRVSTELVGYFQSEKYFAHCAAEIRSIFAPNEKFAAQLDTCWSAFAGRRTASVHVRRTDYVNHDYFANLAATDYYERAIAGCAADTVFLFFSDDIAWCREHFRDPRFVFMDGLGEVADLFLMMRCQTHIIANSSFSWWGAWLDPNPAKQVIAPRSWFAGPIADPAIPFRAGPPHSGFQDTSDLVPSSWLRV